MRTTRECRPYLNLISYFDTPSLAQGVHQEGVEVFDAGATAEADAEHGTEDLAVLKSSELRPFAQLMVDQPAQMFVKHVKDIKNAAERSEIVRFYL